jgi:hypothetical protein
MYFMRVILSILFLLTFFLSKSQKFEQGYTPTKFGKKKDRNNGVFKNYDFVWKQTEDLYVVKKKILEKDSLHTLNSFLVDKNGKILSKKIYTDIGDFSEGLAEVTIGPQDFCRSCIQTKRYRFMVYLNRNCGFIDTKGNEIIKPKYRYVFGGFKNGLCLVGYYDFHLFFIDKNGNQQFNQIFKHGEQFRNGIAAVEYRNGHKNFIDLNGNPLIPKKYEYIQPYNEEYHGMIRAFQPKGDKIGFWTSNCEELLKPQFEDFNYAYLRKKILVKRDKKYGFLDFFTGNAVIPIVYDAVKKDKNLDFTLLKKDGYWLRSDTAFLVQPLVKADDLESIGKGIYKFLINDKWGTIDSTGKIKCQPKFTDISNNFVNDFLPFKSGNKFGYLNGEGEVLFYPKYDKIGVFENGSVFCDEGLNQYKINASGQIIEKNIHPKIIKNTFFGFTILLFIGLIFFVFKFK